MKILVRWLALFYFSLSTLHLCSAQQQPDEIDLLNPDVKKLSLLSYHAVNSLRHDKNLPDLAWDDVLLRAATDHADFLIGKNKLTHFQDIAAKRNPATRVNLHGGITYSIIGENIAEIRLGVNVLLKHRIFSTITHQTTANVLASVWKFSPRHYSNIVSKKYNSTAIGVSYEPSTQRLVAVQVFGYTAIPSTTSELVDYSSQLLKGDVPKLPYGLKKRKRDDDSKHVSTAINFFKLRIDRGHLVGPFRVAKKAFRGRRSAVAQEFIPLFQYDSGSRDFAMLPNRRNGLHDLNGELSKPVTRRTMLKYSRKIPRPYWIYTRLIKIKEPVRLFVYQLTNSPPESDYNVFLIRKRQLQVYRSYLKIPGKFFDSKFPCTPYAHSFKVFKSNDKAKLKYDFDTLTIKIFYPKSLVKPDSAQTEVLKNFVATIKGKVIAVEAEAFASIEGNETDNQRFARGRMENIMAFLGGHLDNKTLKPKLVTQENWKLFQLQVNTHNLLEFQTPSKGRIRHFVNRNANDTLIARLLNEQRYIRLKLVVRNETRTITKGAGAIQVYRDLKSKFESLSKPKSELIRKLEEAQVGAYYDYITGDTTAGLPETIESDNYPVFQYHELVFRYVFLGDLSEKNFYDRLHELAGLKKFPRHLRNEALYNNLALIFQKFINKKISSLMDSSLLYCSNFRRQEFQLRPIKRQRCRKQEHLTERYTRSYFVLRELPSLIRTGVKMDVADTVVAALWKYYYLYTIRSLATQIPLPSELYSYLPGFKQHFHPDDSRLSDEQRVRLAYFYCAIQRRPTALELIKPVALKEAPDKEALKLYICLVSDTFSDHHELAEFLIDSYPKLGPDDWCDLWFSGNYLNITLLEDLKLKRFYNEKCRCD
jgi:uncharacterized protein YkwD